MVKLARATVPLVVLLGVVGILASSPDRLPSTGEERASTPSPAQTAAVSARPSFRSAAGFELDLPPGWQAADSEQMLNRRLHRLFVVGSRSASLPASTNPLGADWSQIPTDGVFLELQTFSFPGVGSGSESTFPLDWAGASPPQVSGDFSISRLSVQNLARSLSLVAYVGNDAPAADVAALNGIVASIRPEPVPSSGEYRGWRVLGPLAAFPIGSVRHFDAQPPGIYGFYLVRGAQSLFAHVDRAYNFMGAIKACPIRYDRAERTFVCDATGDRWSRVGGMVRDQSRYSARAWALARHTVLVKDGFVLVGGGSMSGGHVSANESVEFADPVTIPSPPSTVRTRDEILARYEKLTSTAPIQRAAAKLVPGDALELSQTIRGAVVEGSQVWVVAFAGEIRFPGSGELTGRWSLFYVDAYTGGLISAACCGQGDWPPGFDALPDVAR